MSVKKIRWERTAAGRYQSKHPCACMRLYGMKKCVAEWDAATDMHFYRGIPCEYCGAPINVWENEYHTCKDCREAENHLIETNPWYGESIYAFKDLATPMHQVVTEYVDLDALFEQQMKKILGE